MTGGVDPRRSIESLRAGVPNRDAVVALGTDQRDIEGSFLNALRDVPARRGDGLQAPGFLVQGGFGTGKSHLLEWLQHIALDQGFAVSKVVVSKEAPLSDQHRIFRAAVESLRLPGRRGTSGLHDLQPTLDFRSPAFQAFRARADAGAHDAVFAATLYLFENLRSADQEYIDRIVAFWSGDRLSLADVRRALRQFGGRMYDLKSKRVGELAPGRFRFLADLLQATGQYLGWVILLDEIELVASFSAPARGRSYAVLGGLLGANPEQQYPGIYTVGCATDDFTGMVFQQRRDHEVVTQKLGRHPELIPAVEAGMAFLYPERPERWQRITRLADDNIEAIHRKIRELYADAYGWTPQESSPQIHGYARSLRQYVREWITQWDLARLYRDYVPDIELRDIKPDLQERPALEAAPEDEEPGDLS